MAAKLVNFCTYASAVEAEVAKLAFEAEGIRAYVGDDAIVTAIWMVGPALGGVKLKIAEEDAAAAMAFLERIPSLAGGASARLPDDGTPRCLSCDAAMPAEADACPACGWSFLDGAEPEAEPE